MSDPIADFRRSFQEAAGAASAAPSPIEQFKADTWEAAEAAGAQTRKRLDTSNIDVDRINALKIEANRTNDRVTGEAYTPEEKAIASMSPTQLAIRYPDLYNRMYKQTKEARDTMRDVAHAERGTLSAVTDTAVGAGTTLVSGLVDLAALGVVAKGSAEEAMGDAIGNDLASWLGRKQKEFGLGVVEKNHQVLDWINERALSDELQKHQMLKRVKDDAFSEDAAVRKEQKIAEGKSPTVARLEEIFENLDNSIRSGLDDSVITAHETLSSLASLGIARVASKPANMIGGKIADNIAKNALMKEGIDVLEGQTAKAVLTKTALDQIKNRQKTDLTKAFAKMSKVERAEWGSGLGIMMGSSAFADTVTQVNAMTHSELMSQSPGYKEYFRSLLAQGIDAEEAAGRAKARVSGNAGLMSAVVAGTIAAPTAMISAVGSKSWLQTGSLRDLLASTFVKEPIANAIQEGGAGWAANLAIQEFADEDRSLDEGVAQRASQGALIGAGMAGVLGTPTLAKGTLSASGKTLSAAGKAAQKATEPLAEKVAKARTKKANTATPGTPEHASASYSEVVDSSQEIIENFTKDLEEQGRTTEEIEAAVTDIKKVINAGDTKLTDTTGLSERTSNLIKNSSTTLEAQESILKQFEKAETDKEKLDLALGLVALSNQTNAGTDVLTSLAGEAGIDSLPKNLTAFQKSLDAFEESELVQKAYAGDLMRVFGEYIASQGEGATVDEILFAAEKMPGYVTEAQVDKVFKDESSGSSRQISPAQAAILKAAVSITEAQKKFWKGNPDSSKKGTQAATTRNIFSEPIDNKKQIPLAEHIRIVQNHLLKGNIERAKTSLEVFGLFAQHMMNKKTAMESSTGKKDVKDYVHLAAGLLSWGYASDAESGVASVTETLPDGTVVNYGKGVYHSAKAHELKREAQLVIDVYNSLAETFDVLDMPKVTTAMESIHDKPFLTKEETSEAEAITEEVAEEAPAQPATENKSKEKQPTQQESTTTTAINIYAGANQNTALSNLAHRPFTYEGKGYLSVEHAYQSLKSGSFNQTVYDAYIRQGVSKGVTRKISGGNTVKTDGNYNINLMHSLVKESFLANPKATKQLLSTGDALITHTQDKTIWGKEFPRILMEVREELGKATPQAATQSPVTYKLKEGTITVHPDMSMTYKNGNTVDPESTAYNSALLRYDYDRGVLQETRYNNHKVFLLSNGKIVNRAGKALKYQGQQLEVIKAGMTPIRPNKVTEQAPATKESDLPTSNSQIEYSDNYTREEIRNNPDKVYVFGDNAARKGFGGQAKEARGEPNTIGVRTKYAPSNAESAFFGKDTAKEKEMIDEDLALIRQAIKEGKTVVLPSAGIGTGLASLSTKAPEVAQHLEAGLNEIINPASPKPSESLNTKDEAQRLALVRMAQVAVGLASKKGLSKKQAEEAAKSIQELGPIGKDLLIQLTASLEGASHSAKESEAYGIVAEALYNAGAEHISSINVPAVEIANLGKMVDPSTNKKWAEQYNYLVPLSAQIVTKHRGLGSILTAIGGLGNIEGTNPKLAAAIKEGNTKKALNEIIKDGRSPQPVRQAAAIILGLYESSGMDMPSISLEPALGSFGSYNESKNHISISTSAIPKTLIHEALHGLTTTGIAEVEAAANEGNVDAQEVVQLGIAISNILNDNVSDLSYEGLDRGAFSIEEAVAELANPLFVARAAEIKVPLSSLPAGARNVLKKDTNLLSILKNYVSQVLSWFQIGDANLTEESVALSDLLVSYATEVLPKVEKQPEIVKALTETTQEVATKHFLLEQLKDPTKRKTFEQTFGQTNGPAVLPKVSDLFTYPSKNKAMTAMRKSLTEAMKDFGLTKEEIKRSINKLTLQYSEEISNTEADYLASNSRLAGIKSPIQALQSLLNEGTKEDFLELIGDNAQEFEVSWLLNNKHALGNLLDLAVEIKTSLEDLVSQNPEQMMQFPDMSKYWIFAENTANHGEVDPATGEVITARLNDNFVDSVVLATVQWAVSDLASHSGMFPEEMETASGLQKEQLEQEQIEAMQTGIRVNTAVETIARRAMNYAGVSIDPNAPLGDAIGAFSTLAREAVSSLHHMGKLEEKTLSFQKTAAEYVIGENGKVVMYKNAQGEMVPKELKAATFKKLYVIMPREISVETESISTFSDVLDAVINGVRTRARYVGHDVNIPVPTHQLRNPHTELSDKQKKSIENQNKIVYKIHPKMLSIFRSLGAEGVAKLHGETLPDSNDLDVIREAKEGVLKSFQTGLEETEVLVNMAEEAAGEGESFTDIPIRFAAAVTRVGRTMLLGRATPQGDKVMRHIFLPTNSVGENAINMKDSSSANVVFTALAQGLFDPDQKIYTKSPAAWREYVEEALTYPQLAEMIDLVNQFSMDSGLNIDQLKNLAESLRSASEGKFDIEWNSLALFNLVELANIQGQLGNKSNEGLRTTVTSAPVETSLYIEQDGINNGAANALMSMTSYVAPNDIPSFIRALESAGITFGGTAVPSYELWERVGTDIYGMSAAEYSKTIDRHITSLKRAMKPHQLEAANKIEKAVDTVLSSFMPSYVHNSETDSRTIGRGATKYRLMERIYGSGINGSAKADLGDMINGIYERINDAYKLANERNAEFDPRHLFVKEIRQHRGDKATQYFLGQKGEELFDAINVLLTHVITPINRYGEAYAFRKEELRPLSRKRLTNKKFKLNSSEFEQIAMNIKVLYSSNVRSGIESVLGEGVTDSMALMQEATHTHSNLYGEYIRLKIREATKDRPNHRYISQNELRKIVKDSLKFHPTLSIQDKKILVAKTVDSFIPTIDKKTGLAGELPMVIGKARGFHTAISKRGRNEGKEVPSIRKVTYETKQLGDVGVGALANVNISIGDAEMMTDFLAGEVQDLLHVYDGINLPMYSAMEHGETINKAQLDAWFHNPMKAIEELSESTVVLAAEVGKLLENMYRTEKGTTISESEAIPMYNYKSEVGLPDFAKSLVRAFLPEGSQIGDEPLTIQLIKDTVGNTYHRAREASRRREALQNTFKRIGVSSDQMAALGTPYVLEGDGTVELTGDIQADFSRTYEEELAKVSLIAAPQETAATTPPSESLADKQTTNPKAKSISPAAAEAKAKLVEFLETKRELGGERLALLNELLDTVFDSGDISSVFIGSAAELRSRFPKHRGDYKGLISFANGAVEIALRHDANAETVLHELNHAATIKGLNSAIQLMNTPSEIKTQEQARVVDTFRALLRISEQITEGLPESVLEGLHPSQVEALSRFKELVVNEGLNSSQAVAELLAWGRSNRDLMDALQDVKIDSKTKSLFKKWINTVEELAVRLINLVKVGQPISRRKYVETMAEAVEAGFSIISEYQKDLPPLVGVSKTFAQSVNDPKSQKNILTSRINTAAERIELTREENIALGEFVNTTSNVFGTTGEDLELHKNLYILFSRPENLDSTLLSELSRARTEAIRNLELSDFVSDGASSQERAEAYKMLNELLIPAQDDTSGLANFAALALTNSQVQKALTNVDTRTTLEGYTGVNNLLTYAGHKLIDGTTRAATGVRGTNSLVLANSAVERMITRLEVGESSILDLPYRKGDQVNDILKNNLGGENITKAGDKLKGLGMDKLGAAVSSVGGIVAAAEKGLLPDLIIKLSSKHENRLGPISSLAHGLVRELVGRTKDNAQVYDLIKQSTYAVDTVRKNFKSTIPGVLRKKFKNLTPEDTSTLTDTMYQGGITGVLGAYNAKDAAKLFVESSYRDSEKAAAETEIAQLTTNNPRLAQAIYSKAEQLAHYITTGEPGINLLQNSYAIAKGYGTNVKAPDDLVTPLMGPIDRLISAYTAEKLDPSVRDRFAELYAKDPSGVDDYFGYVKKVTESEKAKYPNILSANTIFGYMPVETKHGRDVVISPESNHNKMVSLGYTKGEKVVGTQDRYVYFTKHNPKARFGKGIVQIVTKSYMGMDVATGASLSPFRQSVTDSNDVLRIQKEIAKNPDAAKAYVPLYGTNGLVVGYDLVLDKNNREFLVGSGDAFNAIGVWESRQVEEALADSVNQELIGSLKSMWDDAKNTPSKARMFVDITNEKLLSTTEKDALKLIPVEVRTQLVDAFGDSPVFIRRDLLMDVIGRRDASVSDFFTGSSDWSPRTQAFVRNLLISVLGEKAVKTLLIGEDFMQSLTNYARHNIVIASGIVPAINAISSAAQLAANGVPLNKILGEYPKITRELETFVRNRTRLIELDTELKIGGHDALKTQKLVAEMKAIEAANSKLSIKELIDKGELNTIADLGIEKEDMNIFTGRVGEWLSEKLLSLPPKAQEAARIGLVTKDTAYYKAMEKVTLYGDFIPKAILYKHLQAKGKSKEEAYGHITEEFVNYDRLSGRTRGALESVGLIWFFNWKLRSTKIAARTVVNNPLYALTLAAAPLPMGSTMAFSENAISRLLTNNWGSSFGLDPILRSYQLNPVAQVLGL